MPTPANLNPKITQAGLAIAPSATNPGFHVELTHVALGTGRYVPNGDETALKEEVARYAITSGTNPSPRVVQVGCTITDLDSSTPARSPNGKGIGEVGFYAGDTLFAVWSQDAEPVFYKTAAFDIPMAYTLDVSALPDGAVTVTVDMSKAGLEALILAHEAKADPHPQYMTAAEMNSAVSGQNVIDVAGGANVILTAAQAAYGVLSFTGVLTADIAVIVPKVAAKWKLYNATSGAFTLTVKTDTGAGVAVSQGRRSSVWCDGLGVYLQHDDFKDVAHTGNPTAPTPPQFDKDTSLATTAFVQRALGNVAGGLSFSAGGAPALAAADAGKMVILTGVTAGTLSLPALASVPDGAAFMVKNESAASWTVAVAAGDANGMSYGNGAYANIPMIQDDFIIFVKGFNQWRIFGTGALKWSGSFAANKAASGYQKLPGGVIIQWGTVSPPAYTTANSFQTTAFSFPVAFPNAVGVCTGTLKAGNSGTVYANLSIEAPTQNGATVVYASGVTNTAIVSFIAIGW